MKQDCGLPTPSQVGEGIGKMEMHEQYLQDRCMYRGAGGDVGAAHFGNRSGVEARRLYGSRGDILMPLMILT